ncbi:uncharacterized protein LOC106166977 [Lingula anatina]|uniref:Uncharacterized protein LOC106166977 n=1 Tax=Lingula anatina TaxID=7574 RepID=A0A1S3IT31_LINAN|nr:uncharacterized protein LOC106166977 [Lingula anatina]|eukprot:XP_013401091.1 uncharacterized protein LOC106166977 [Lingula anatina]
MTRERMHAVILWILVVLKVPSRKPVVTGYNGNEILTHGRNANLTCESSCSYPNTTLNWMSTSETIDQQNIREEISYCRDELYKTTSVLFVPGKETSSGKAYFTCTASSNEPSIPSLNETVLVNFEKIDPNITSGLDNQTLTVGQSYGFNCEADGFPTLVIEWIKEATGDIVSNSSFLNISNAAVSDSGWYICNASSSTGAYDFKRFHIQVIGPPTTTGMTEVISTTVPPDNKPALVAALVTLIIISLIGSCSVCIFVCIKYPDKASSLKCIVDCICITVVFLCVILGNICGGVLWRTVDPNQDVGIIVLVIILSDLGFFILGIVVGMIKDWKEQTQDKDKVLRDILVKLPNIVLSVATFGGVSAGIAIAFSCKNGKTRRASITPEETQTCPRRENSANSKDSAASQSGVPLHEGIGHNTREESDTIPMQKVKKKKKKKPEKRSKEPYIQKVPSPRKLPPLKT